MDWADWGGMAATCFLSALLLAANGFGFALLAVPLLLLFADPGVTVQLVIIVSVAVLVVVLPGLRHAVDARLLLRLALGSLIGLPFGLLAFCYADPALVRGAVGVVVLAFALVLVLARCGYWRIVFAMRPGRDLAAGALAGAATALVGISGPPVVIYLMLAGAPPRTTRATLLAFFTLCYAATLVAHIATVGVPGATWRLAGGLVPFAWAGGFLGRRLGDRLGAGAAAALAISVLAAAGVYAVATAIGLTVS